MTRSCRDCSRLLLSTHLALSRICSVLCFKLMVNEGCIRLAKKCFYLIGLFHYCRTARWQNSRSEQSVFSITNGYSLSGKNRYFGDQLFYIHVFSKTLILSNVIVYLHFFSITYNLKEFFQSITWQLIRLSTCIKSHDLLII